MGGTMINGETESLAKIAAPFAKEVELLDVTLENDVNLLRVRIREGRRFTILDLDPVTANKWGKLLVDWASEKSESE